MISVSSLTSSLDYGLTTEVIFRFAISFPVGSNNAVTLPCDILQGRSGSRHFFEAKVGKSGSFLGAQAQV